MSIYFEVKLYLPTPASIKLVFSKLGKGLSVTQNSLIFLYDIKY